MYRSIVVGTNSSDGAAIAVAAATYLAKQNGATLHVATGLSGDEQVIKIAVPGLVEGDPLEVGARVGSPPQK